MLQLHSSKAWQRITYHCFNSIPWGNLTQNAIKLLGDDDIEFRNRMTGSLRPILIQDNCKVLVAYFSTLIHLENANGKLDKCGQISVDVTLRKY